MLGLLLAPGAAKAADYTWSNTAAGAWSTGAWSGAGSYPNGAGDNLTTPSAYGRLDMNTNYVVGNVTFGTPEAKATTFWQIVPQNTVGSPTLTLDITGTLSVGDNAVFNNSVETQNQLVIRNTTYGTLSLKINNIDSSGYLFLGQNETSVLTKLEVTGLTEIKGRLLSVTANEATFGEVRISQPTEGVSSIFRVSNYRTNNSTGGVTVAGLSGSAGIVQGGNAGDGQTVTGTLKINTQAGTSYAYNGTLVDGIGTGTNHLVLVKQGAGTQIIGGANTHTGGTRIEAGTLLVTNTDAATSGLGTGAVEVQNGGVLGGNGYVALGGSNTISVLAGGAISAGQGGLGTLTLNGGSTSGAILSLANGAAFNFDLGSGNASDRIAFWNYAGSSDFLLSNNVIHFTGAQEGVYTLFEFFSDNGLTTAASGLTSGLDLAGFTGLEGYQASINYGASDITLTLTAVPEPGTMALLGVCAAAGLLVKLRRRQS